MVRARTLFALPAASPVSAPGLSPGLGSPSGARRPDFTPAFDDNDVLQWNTLALQAVRQSKLGPPMVSRALAILHTCMFDAAAEYHDASGDVGRWRPRPAAPGRAHTGQPSRRGQRGGLRGVRGPVCPSSAPRRRADGATRPHASGAGGLPVTVGRGARGMRRRTPRAARRRQQSARRRERRAALFGPHPLPCGKHARARCRSRSLAAGDLDQPRAVGLPRSALGPRHAVRLPGVLVHTPAGATSSRQREVRGRSRRCACPLRLAHRRAQGHRRVLDGRAAERDAARPLESVRAGHLPPRRA